MARLRSPVTPRHPGVDRAWLALRLTELEVLVSRNEMAKVVQLGEALMRELDARRGCGPRRGSWWIGRCAACREVDEADERVTLPYFRARLAVPT